MVRTTDAPAQTLGVIFADRLKVTFGAQEGDALSFASELVLDDIYQLEATPDWQQLTLVPLPASAFLIEDGSETGASGARVHLDCCATFASADGQLFDILILVEIDDTAFVKAIYAYPLQTIPIKTDLRLMRIDKDQKSEKFAQVACSSFTLGTRITLADGAQCLIQDLEVGDMVLTMYDNGVILDVSPSAAEIIGAAGPLQGRSIYDFMRREDRDNVRACLNAAAEGRGRALSRC